MTPEEKKKAFSSLKNSLKKKWGDSVLSDHTNLKIDFVSTGSPMLDSAIGGGIPVGRFVEIFGEESGGKTTLATIALSNFQKARPDDMVGYIDVEHAFNVAYSNKLGLDTSPEKFIMSQPSSADEALSILLQFCESGLFSVVCLDSVGGLITQQQLDKGLDEETMGSLARLLSKSASRIATAASNSGTTVIWINQQRNKIVLLGNPEVVAGGKALPYFHSVRIRVRKTAPIVDKETSIGQEIECKIIKNKVGPPFGIVQTSLFFGKGFDEVRETVEVAYKNEYVSASGAWCYIGKGTDQEMKWNGKNALIAYCRENSEFYQKFKINAFSANTAIDSCEKSSIEESEDDY